MKVNFGKATAALTMVTMALSMSTIAFAAQTDDSYGYLVGQESNSNRHTQFEAVANFATDAQRKSFFEEQGIGGDGSYHAVQHLNSEELVDAGIIDQETANKIENAASKKHEEIHAGYGKKDNLTPEELHTFYESFKTDHSDTDLLVELRNDGIITQEQADAIGEYCSNNL